MGNEAQSPRSGRGRMVLLALVCLLIGGAVGRWAFTRKPAGEQKWADVDELTQIFVCKNS